MLAQPSLVQVIAFVTCHDLGQMLIMAARSYLKLLGMAVALLLLCLFVVYLYLCQLFYILFFHLRITLHRNKKFSQASTKVSIIICARNERRNLALYLESFLKQDYENFEIIAIDDSSEDKTGEIIEINRNLMYISCIQEIRHKMSLDTYHKNASNSMKMSRLTKHVGMLVIIPYQVF